MVARRARFLAGMTVLAGIIALAGAAPAAAADCALTAPAYVNVGTPLTIEGTGFPATTDVDVSLSVEGGPSDEFTLQSDANGALQIALVPEDIDIGVTTVQATAGSTCSASVTYTVLAAGATPPPAPTEEPESGTGGEPTAPQTDAAAEGGRQGSPMTALWALALVLAGVGSVGLILTRSPRRR